MTTTQLLQALFVLAAMTLTLLLAVAPRVAVTESSWFLHPSSDHEPGGRQAGQRRMGGI